MLLYVGLCVFIFGTGLCVIAPTIETLIAGRFVQALGGAALIVVPAAIIRDLYTGNDATRLMALIMMVISVSPLLAPVLGSWVILTFDWRAVFYVLAVAGLASSLGGTLQILCGGLIISAAGPFFDGTAAPMIVTIAICGVMSFAIARVVLGANGQMSPTED